MPTDFVFDGDDGDNSFRAFHPTYDIRFDEPGSLDIESGTIHPSNTTIRGGGGDDTIAATLGNNVYDGGTGLDTLTYEQAGFFTNASGTRPFNPITPFQSIGTTLALDRTIADQTGVRIDAGAGTATYAGATFSKGNEDYSIFGNRVGSFSHAIAGFEVLIGTTGNDTIIGSDADETISGGAGSDILNGRGGYDEVIFAVGAGFLSRGVTFSFAGEVSDDGVIFDADGATGVDRIRNFEGVIATNGDDSLTGTAKPELFAPLGGADTIDGRGGIDTIDYSRDGLFNRGAIGTTGAIEVDLDNGRITDSRGFVDIVRNIEVVIASAFDDLLTGDETSNRLEGADGNDTLNGKGGSDHMEGGDGDDSLSGGVGNDVMRGGAGKDTLAGGAGRDNITGGGEDDSIRGDGGTDFLFGGPGNDLLDGGKDDDKARGDRGNDTLKGGDGNDSLSGRIGNDSIEGGSGNDTLLGEKQNDTLMGGRGRDTLDGDVGHDVLDGGRGRDDLIDGPGNDLIRGGPDNDTFFLGTGRDTLDGGNGNVDLVTFAEQTSGVRVNLATGTAVGGGLGGKLLSGIEAVSVSEGRNIFLGDDADNLFFGGTGRDRASGQDGDDVLEGGNLADTLVGGAGDDRLAGDEGGGTISTQDGNDSLEGNRGNDSLLGGGGRDTLDGGADNDLLQAEGGNDVLIGGQGRDTLDGGSGSDVMTGGSDRDVFVLSLGHDRITDFNRRADRIDVSGAGLDNDGVPTFANLVEVTRFAHDVGGNTVFRFSPNHTLTVEGVLPEQFEVFAFVFDGA